MDGLSWLIAEMLAEQARHAPAQPTPPTQHNGQRGMKRSLASTLVRLGLRLDPAAGEGLGAIDLSLASGAGRRA